MATSLNSICTTCNHNENCVFRKDSIIWDCSEFDDSYQSAPEQLIQILESPEAKVRLSFLEMA